jgi:uncharacterized protein YlxW (UPF0749 family)
MNGGQMTAVMIVAIVMFASIVRALLVGPRRRRNCSEEPQQIQTQAENQRLRDEVGQLKERLKVLERITVEKENSLSREIESLRDR